MKRNMLLRTGEPALDSCFILAQKTLEKNIHLFQDRLLEETVQVINAGADYNKQWTRDAAFNTWFAGGLLAPEAARNTLLAVLRKEEDGIRIGGEYWDAVIWVWGAWYYYLYTADRDFLSIAPEAADRSLDYFLATEYDPEDGLFRGGACFQDGIAGYPARFLSKRHESGIVACLKDHPPYLASRGVGLPMKAFSTNLLYLLAMETADRMRAELCKVSAECTTSKWKERAGQLRRAISTHFQQPGTLRYHYLLDAGDDRCRQEGLGYAFALLTGLVGGGDREARFVAETFRTPQGIACVWPGYERYTGQGGFGRHSGTVWSHVNAAWSHALALHGFRREAWRELQWEYRRVKRAGGFYELYHPESGEPYGGLQESFDAEAPRLWTSCRDQTWCATGYINMVLTVLGGLEFSPEGAMVCPYLPDELVELHLENIPYREAVLNIHVSGGYRDRNRRGIFVPADRRGTVNLNFPEG